MGQTLDQNLRDIQELRQEISSVRRRAQRRASKYLVQGTTAFQTGKRLFTDYPVGSFIVTVGLGIAALATTKAWWTPLREQTESTWRNWDWQQIYNDLLNLFFKSTTADDTDSGSTAQYAAEESDDE